MSGNPEIERPIDARVGQAAVPDNQDELLYQKQEQEALNQAKELLKQIAADDAAAASAVPQPTAQSKAGTSAKTIMVPTDDPIALTTQSKGDTSNSLTWWAAYWLRMLKKALINGWNVVYAKLSPSKK